MAQGSCWILKAPKDQQFNSEYAPDRKKCHAIISQIW